MRTLFSILESHGVPRWLGRLGVSLGVLLAVLCMLPLSGCSSGYAVRAAYEEAMILWRRQPIDEYLQEESLDAETRFKLTRVLQARDFAETQGLDPAETFTSYSAIDREVLAWILMAAQRHEFSLYTWWFPVVGRVPYKGYFEKESALEAAQELEAEGYETRVRPTEAFSTLGWFDDPLMSTTLANSELDVVTTVLHEIVHSTIWFPGYVTFNESLAQFLGVELAVEFYKGATLETKDNGIENPATLEQALEARKRYLALSKFYSESYATLRELYSSDKSKEEKIAERQSVYDQLIDEYFPTLTPESEFRTLNNAALMQTILYVTGVECFSHVLDSHENDFEAFLATMFQVKEDSEDSERSPFEILGEKYPENCEGISPPKGT